jgi:hypothetical protein
VKHLIELSSIPSGAKVHFHLVLTKLCYIARRRWLCVVLIGLIAFAGSAAVGLFMGIAEPKIHDEFSYLLAADTFAHGRLTNPSHPMWVHFESFHVIQQPTYMSKYPPAQGLAVTAGQLVGGYPIVGVWMSFGLMCAAICWMLYAWVSPHWAILGASLAMINPTLGIAGYWAQSYWGGAVAATGGALVLGGTRRLVCRPRVYVSLLTAIGLAILANSRPFEGLLISLPAGIFLFIQIVGQRGRALRISIQKIVVPISTVLALTTAAMGFYNLRITGHPLRMPYQIHEETYGMAPLLIWQKPPPEPKFHQQTIRDFHATYELALYNEQLSIAGFIDKIAIWFSLLILRALNVLAIPLIGMFTVLIHWILKNRWAQRAVLVYCIMICGLLLETFRGLHYAAPVIALNYFFVVTAMRLWLRRDRRIGQFIFWLVPILAILGIGKSLYETIKENNSTAWHIQRAQLLKQLKQEDGKHLIVVSYGAEHSVHDEWVYNGADIDGAKVIFARAIKNTQDCQLVEYFKSRRIWTLNIDGDQSKPQLKPYPLNLCN